MNLFQLPSGIIINLDNIGSIGHGKEYDEPVTFVYNRWSADPWFKFSGKDKEAFDKIVEAYLVNLNPA